MSWSHEGVISFSRMVSIRKTKLQAMDYGATTLSRQRPVLSCLASPGTYYGSVKLSKITPGANCRSREIRLAKSASVKSYLAKNQKS